MLLACLYCIFSAEFNLFYSQVTPPLVAKIGELAYVNSLCEYQLEERMQDDGIMLGLGPFGTQ